MLPQSTRDRKSISEFVACIDPLLHIADYSGERDLIDYGSSHPSKYIHSSSLLISKIREYSNICLQIIRELWISSTIQWPFVFSWLLSIEESIRETAIPCPKISSYLLHDKADTVMLFMRTHVNFRDSRDFLKSNDRSSTFWNLPSHAIERTKKSIVQLESENVPFRVLLVLKVLCHECLCTTSDTFFYWRDSQHLKHWITARISVIDVFNREEVSTFLVESCFPFSRALPPALVKHKSPPRWTSRRWRLPIIVCWSSN
jgi:hypothetical protein